MKHEKEKTKKPGNGFGLRLAMAIILFVFTAYALSAIIMFKVVNDEWYVDVIIIAIGLLLLSVLQTVFAVAGKKHKWANVGSIVIGSFCAILAGLGALAIVGGVRGNKPFKKGKPEKSAAEETVYKEHATAESENTAANALGDIQQKLRENYPVDYENKPTVSQLFDESNDRNLLLTNEDGVTTVEFTQLYVTLHNDAPYALCETVGLDEQDGGGLVVFRIDYENDKLNVEQDDTVSEAVYEEYKSVINGAQTVEKKKIKRSEFKLDLYDANVDEKTWKNFKKTATQDELAVIAIGAKYRIAHSRIMNIVYAIGIILSIALFWPTGGYSLIGYPVFAFLATKAIRYQDTFNQTYRKLNKENKALVDGYYNSNAGLVILDLFIQLATFWLTLPYQAILMLIGLFAPNFVISKNGILVSLPKGYDVGNLGAVGAYYASFSFYDEYMAAVEKRAAEEAKHQVEYKTSDGDTVTVDDRAESYTIDGATVYKDKYGDEYLSYDGGKHINKKEDR